MTQPIDIEISRIAFGGVAFEPLTEAGKRWASRVTDDPDLSVFRQPDGCMAGFSEDAFGVEPQDFERFYEDARSVFLNVQPPLEG